MPPARFGCNPMDNHGQRVHGLCIHEDVHLDQITLTHTDLVIIEAGITPADGFQPIVKIEHDFIEGQFISDLCPRSEEHTSELQSLMRISYAVFCLKKTNKITMTNISTHVYINTLQRNQLD